MSMATRTLHTAISEYREHVAKGDAMTLDKFNHACEFDGFAKRTSFLHRAIVTAVLNVYPDEG